MYHTLNLLSKGQFEPKMLMKFDKRDLLVVLRITKSILQTLNVSNLAYLFRKFWGSYFNKSSLHSFHETSMIAECDSPRT